jgi:hypothetical protein
MTDPTTVQVARQHRTLSGAVQASPCSAPRRCQGVDRPQKKHRCRSSPRAPRNPRRYEPDKGRALGRRSFVRGPRRRGSLALANARGQASPSCLTSSLGNKRAAPSVAAPQSHHRFDLRGRTPAVLPRLAPNNGANLRHCRWTGGTPVTPLCIGPSAAPARCAPFTPPQDDNSYFDLGSQLSYAAVFVLSPKSAICSPAVSSGSGWARCAYRS